MNGGISMGRAEELFEDINRRGFLAIEDLFVDRTYENLFLDFKRINTNATQKGLDNSDRNNLAKAISGFGNSEGGLVIWGIDCSTSGGQPDIAAAKLPVVDPAGFATKIENAVSGLTIPIHSTIQTHTVEDTSQPGKGYVVTLIPQSNYAPHQTTHDRRYLIRVGSNFEPVPHDVLSGMFGRRPQPRIIHRYIINPAEVKVIGGQHVVETKFWIKLVNTGRGIASDAFLNAIAYSVAGEVEFLLPTNEWNPSLQLGVHYSAILKPEHRIPPQAWGFPVGFRMVFKNPISKGISLEITYGSGQSEPVFLKLDTTKEIIVRAMDEIVDTYRNGRLTDEEKYNFTKAIVKDIDLEKGNG